MLPSQAQIVSFHLGKKKRRCQVELLYHTTRACLVYVCFFPPDGWLPTHVLFNGTQCLLLPLVANLWNINGNSTEASFCWRWWFRLHPVAASQTAKLTRLPPVLQTHQVTTVHIHFHVQTLAAKLASPLMLTNVHLWTSEATTANDSTNDPSSW